MKQRGGGVGFFSAHWLCEILGPACITLVNRKERDKDREGEEEEGKKGDEGRKYMTSRKALDLALKKLSDLIVLSGRAILIMGSEKVS